MTDKFTELAGFSPDAASDVGIRMKVLAAQIFSLTTELTGLKRDLFPTTAAGAALDLHAQTRGLARKEATRAAGVLRFLRQTPASTDVSIEQGTVCQTEGGGGQYETTQAGVLAAGALFVDIPARSVEAGEHTNAAAGRVCVFAAAPQGLHAVENPTPFEGGSPAEGDEALRQRLLTSYRTISNQTNAAFYYDRTMKYPSVYSASVLPRPRGIGTVDVVAAARGGVLSPEELSDIETELLAAKELCVDVTVRSPVLHPVAVAVEVNPLDEYGFATAKAAVEQRVTDYLLQQAIGQPLFLSPFSAALCGAQGVYNHRVTAPTADITVAPDELLTLGALTVTRMG